MFSNLKAEMARIKLTAREMARQKGWCETTLYNKFNGKSDFSREMMLDIRNTWFADKTLEYLFKLKEE